MFWRGQTFRSVRRCAEPAVLRAESEGIDVASRYQSENIFPSFHIAKHSCPVLTARRADPKGSSSIENVEVLNLDQFAPTQGNDQWHLGRR